MLRDKKGHCKYQGSDGWSDKPTCKLEYNQVRGTNYEFA